MNRKILLTIFSIPALFIPVLAQQATAEDSLHKNLSGILSNTSIGGYGNAFYQRDFNLEESTINLERFVLFVGHSFNNKISLLPKLKWKMQK